MNYRIVARVVLGVVSLFVAVSLTFAYLMTHPTTQAVAATPAAKPVESGEALFARHCGGCHTVAEVAPAVRADPKKQLEFLQQHGAASDAEDRIVVDYLRELK